MVPLIKRSTDVLGERFEEVAASKKSVEIRKSVVYFRRERGERGGEGEGEGGGGGRRGERERERGEVEEGEREGERR